MPKDNIIDFNSGKKRQSPLSGSQPATDEQLQASVHHITEALGEHFSLLPQNGLLRATGDFVAEKISMLIMLGFIAGKISEILEGAGLDPDNFTADEDSLDRFMGLEETEIDVDLFMKQISENNEDALELLWNGPYFDWNDDSGIAYRAATTIFKHAMGEFGLSIDLLRISEDDDNWQIYNDGQWVDGPSRGFFEFLETRRDGWFDGDFFDEDDEDDDDDWDDDDWDDDDEWESSVESMPLSDNIISALRRAGIEKIETLKQMTDAELLAINGIGKKSVKSIREALEYEDD